jgi:DNA-binding XRE family transcriptional regulator
VTKREDAAAASKSFLRTCAPAAGVDDVLSTVVNLLPQVKFWFSTTHIITSEVSRKRAMLLRRRESCGIFHGRKVYSRRSAATARRDFRNMSVTNVELLKLGLRIRASRKVLGWTQKRFSRKCGLDRSYFGGVERGKRNMTFSVLCQICDGLSCDIATVTKGIPHWQTAGG